MRASEIDSSLKFLLCRCWLFLPECFWTKAINQISCSNHSSLLCALVLSIWLSHFSGPQGSAGDAGQHQACEGGKDESFIMVPVVWTHFISPIQLGANFRVHFGAGHHSSSLLGCAHANVQTTDAARAAAKREKIEGGYAHYAGRLLFSLLISSNLLIPILKPPPRGPAATFYVSPRAR